VPEQVTAEFDDALKAGADRDRFKNEGRAYASDVIPAAQGDASRLRLDAESYKARVVGAAEGDANRFKAVLAEYQKAPAVTRDRMYLDTMREVYENVTKIMVDTHGSNNLVQLPLDKLLQAGAANATPASTSSAAPSVPAETQTVTVDPRTRDNPRGRDRDGR
jgi:membrane protease subunit HflK